MANHKSAIKRMKQNEVRRMRNRAMRTKAKTCIKKVMTAVEENRIDDAKDSLRVATSVLYKCASKGVYHRNMASRKVSRLAARVNALSN